MKEIRIGKWAIPLPRARAGRIAAGIILVILGFFGFLPVLGFWMIPLGLAILSYEIPFIRRLRRRFMVWFHRLARRRFPRPAARIGAGPKDGPGGRSGHESQPPGAKG